MTFLAILLGGVAVAAGLASFAMLRVTWQSLEKLSDTVRVLQVSVHGLEAALLGEVEATREAADAALLQATKVIEVIQEIKSGPDVESAADRNARMSAFGRVVAARDLFSRLEEDSYREKFGTKAVNGG